MSKKPVGRKTANSNRTNLGDEERENAKYDALLKERGLFDDDMTLQEKRDYYEALVASMSVSESKAGSAQGRMEMEEVDPPDHSNSDPTSLYSTVGDVANGSDSQKCTVHPQKSIRDVEDVDIVSDPHSERGTNVCTVKATPVKRSSSPPPLEDTPDPNRPRRRMSDLEGDDELETEAHSLLKTSKLVVEIEDSNQDVIQTVPNAETTYSLPKEVRMPISDALVTATTLEVKNHLQKFCQKLQTMNLTGNEGSLVFFSPEELQYYKVKDLPKFCRPETLEDPIVQQEILKLNTILNAKHVPPDPETLTLDEQVDLIVNQPKYVTRVLSSNKRNKISSSRKITFEDDQFNDGKSDPQDLDAEKFGQANSCGLGYNFCVAASSDEELIVNYKPGKVKAEAKSEARSNTRATTLAKPFNVESDEDFEPDELIQRKTASKHLPAGSKGRAIKSSRGTTTSTKLGNRGRRVGRGRGRDDSEEEIKVVDVLSLGTNKRTVASPPSSGTHTQSFVPVDITKEFIDKKHTPVPKVYGATRRLEPKHNTGSSPSTSSSVRCGGVNVAEFLQSPNLPEVIRKRTMDSLTGCTYCPKTFIASDFLEKDGHEKLCRVSQSTRTTAAKFCTGIATCSDESDKILVAVPPLKSSSRKAKKSNGDGALTNKRVTEPGIETASPTPKRSRKRKN